MYDLSITSMFSFKKEKHIKMAENFSKFGILNIQNKKVCLNALIHKKDRERFESLHFDYDVNIVEFENDNISEKIHGFYFSHIKNMSQNTRWHMQVDDDSSTDANGLITMLDNMYDYTIPMTMLAANLNDVWYGIEEFFQDNNFFKKISDNSRTIFAPNLWIHDWESSIQSMGGLQRIAASEKCYALFKLLSERDGMPGDHCMAAASLISKIPVFVCKFIHFGNVIDDFSLNGGNFYHIHYLNDESYKKLLNIQILNEHFINKPLRFYGEASHEIVQYSDNFILGDDNLIHGYSNTNEAFWKIKDNMLEIYTQNGFLGAIFTLSPNLLSKKTLVGQFRHGNIKHPCMLKIKE